ncbi:MAG TPA: single-stranded-DNA-specific exonuclease RecJ [Acidobacteriota bacterium]|nr:single-stranded-DNA-specific exonuclease RecJ [Acidobacteriota bacterium]
MRYRWQAIETDGDAADRLARDMDIDRLLARLLLQRGIADPDQARSFLNPRLEDLHDPFLMRDMQRVVERVERALREKEKILIYGDYDVDGITSTVVLRRALEMLGGKVDFHIPARLEDGYGLQPDVMREFALKGFSLIISVDSGVRAFESCRAAREAGADLIVTDHHTPAETLPEAYAILNPKRFDCSYPCKDLAAVGVVFKLVQALFQRSGRETVLPHFLKLVAIGTVADIVPVVGENRIIVKYGLQGLERPNNLGLQELLVGAGVEGPVGLSDVGFRIAPRINAVTRMGGGREVVDLFALSDRRQARRLVEEMNRKNDARRGEEERILEEIEDRVAERPQDFSKRFLVVAGRDWHRGVIGIVASRLVDRFHRPVLVLSVGSENTQGSGRSITPFNLVESLDRHASFFQRHGGHPMAVGCTLQVSDLEDPRLSELSAALNDHADQHLDDEDLVPRLKIACELPAEAVSLGLCRQVERLAPYGVGNPTPVFASRAMPVAAGPWLLKERHLKFQVQCNGSRVDAIWWKNAQAAEGLSPGSPVDLAFTLGRQFFQGEESLQLTIRDLHA